MPQNDSPNCQTTSEMSNPLILLDYTTRFRRILQMYIVIYSLNEIHAIVQLQTVVCDSRGVTRIISGVRREKKVKYIAQYGNNYPENFGTNFGIFRIFGPLTGKIYKSF